MMLPISTRFLMCVEPYQCQEKNLLLIVVFQCVTGSPNGVYCPTYEVTKVFSCTCCSTE